MTKRELREAMERAQARWNEAWRDWKRGALEWDEYEAALLAFEAAEIAYLSAPDDGSEQESK